MRGRVTEAQMTLLLLMLLHGECEHECNEHLLCIFKGLSQYVVKGPAAFVSQQNI